MTSEVIVDVQPKEISIALLEDKRLVEFQKEGRSASFVVGNIYLAKVRKLMPGLNACFVNVGYERDAFLHYLDLGTKYNTYNKYLRQVISDKKKFLPISKASIQPDLEKDHIEVRLLQPVEPFAKRLPLRLLPIWRGRRTMRPIQSIHRREPHRPHFPLGRLDGEKGKA